MSENIISSNNETMREPKRKYLQRNLENLNIIKFQKYRENIIHLSKSLPAGIENCHTCLLKKPTANKCRFIQITMTLFFIWQFFTSWCEI